jgi:predicted O-methyltransferase YrrM
MTVLEQILTTGKVKDDKGNQIPVGSEIPLEEGECISGLIHRLSISRSLEIGCAYGISSLYICEAISRQSNPHHIIIDPFQADSHHIGLRNLQRAGFMCWELIEEPSELALPRLLQSGVSVQFALIDGYHTFDQALIDFFYVDRLLEDGGVVAFDDAQMRAIDKVIRYALRYPNYRFLEGAIRSSQKKSIKRQLFEFVLHLVTRMVSMENQERYFEDSWLRPAEKIGLGGRFVFLQKSGPSFCELFGNEEGQLKIDSFWKYSGGIKREWNWYRHF